MEKRFSEMKSNWGLKTRTAFSNALRNDLHRKLMALSEETMIPVSKLLDQAVELVLEKYEAQ